VQTEIKANDFTRFNPFGLLTFLLYDNVYVESAALALDGQGLDLAIEIPTVPVGKVLLAYLNLVEIVELIPGLFSRERTVLSRLLKMWWISLLAGLQVREEQPICSVYPIGDVLYGL
jgi:hypothetical protein